MTRQEAAWYALVLGRLLRRPGLVLRGEVVELVYLYSHAVCALAAYVREG